MFDASALPSDSVVAAQLLLFSVSLHYLQNISSIYFLAHVSVLSHQVAQSLKRLLVIACSVLYFHTPVTALNCAGMSLALVGFFAYSLTKQSAAAGSANSGAVNGDGWSSHKQQQSPRANGLYSSHALSDREGREHERGYYSGGTNSRLRLGSQPNTPRQLSDGLHSHSPSSAHSSAASSSLSSSSLTASPTLPAFDSVMDSYALVRASELGSSHLLQSPGAGALQQPQLRYPHSNSAHGQSHALAMQPLSLTPHQHTQQRLVGRADSVGGTLPHAEHAGQHSAHSHAVDVDERVTLLSAHDDRASNGHGLR